MANRLSSGCSLKTELKKAGKKLLHLPSSNTELLNVLKEDNEAIQYTTEKSKFKNDTNRRIKLEYLEDNVNSSLTPSKSLTYINGKRKRDYSLESVAHGENLVGNRIKVWWPGDEMQVLYDDGFEEFLDLNCEKWALVENVSTISDSVIICVNGYNVKQSVAPILESIFKKHGDIAAKCLFKNTSVRASFLEVICGVVTQIETSSFTKMKEIESEVVDAEAANINVSWLRAHLEATHKTLLMETKSNTILVEKAARKDLKERFAELMAAKLRFENAKRCVKVLNLVKKKVNDNILELKAEK